MYGTSGALIECDWARLDAAARLDALADLEQHLAAVQAARLRLLAAIAAQPATVSLPGVTLQQAKDWAAEDVAPILRVSPASARARLAEATQAVRLPGFMAQLAEGRITGAHLSVAAELTMPLDDAQLAAVEERVTTRAADQSVGAFRASVRRAVMAVDGRSAAVKAAANIAERRVCVRPAGDGVAELWALLPADGAATVLAAVQALAESTSTAGERTPDERSADQRRADALIALAAHALEPKCSLPISAVSRAKPAVHLTVAASTLLGLDDEPGELAGHGPVPAAMARAIAADPTGRWRRLVTDPVGRLLDFGRRTYRPPAPLAQHVRARDRTCRFPRCLRRAERSELDHTLAWADGGATAADNLVTLCARHHHLRHETGWTYRTRAGGDVVWTSPGGQTHPTPAATYPVPDPHRPPF